MTAHRARCFALLALAALVACEPTSATDRDKGLRELREIEATNAKYAPDIPMSERVGCEACPHECTFLDLRLVPLDELFRDYRENALLIYDLSNIPETELWIHAKRQIHRISCIAKRSGPAGHHALAAYLDDESLLIQVATADLMLYRDIDRMRAYRRLDHIQKHFPRIPFQPGFVASSLILKWRSEIFPLYHAKQYREAHK